MSQNVTEHNLIRWKDYNKVKSLKDSLLLEVDTISKQQGFVKNHHDICQCINFVDRGYVPKRFINGRYKSARKLHNSLQIYLSRLGLLYFPRVKFVNIFTDYKLDIMPKTPKKLDKDLMTVCLTEENLKHSNETYYRKSEVNLTDEDDNTKISLKGRKKLHTLYTQLPGRKYVCKNHSYLINLKRKYSTSEELNDDLYCIYRNWYDSKVESGRKHVEIHNSYITRVTKNPNVRVNKNHVKYFLSKKLLLCYVQGSLTVPKRFLKIVSFLRCLKDRKAVKNNTMVDSIVTNITVVTEDKSESGMVKSYLEDSKLRVNVKFYSWLVALTKQLVEQRYLTYNDWMIKKRGSLIDYNYLNSKFLESINKPTFLKRFKARVQSSLYNSLKKYVIRKFVQPFLTETDVMLYKESLDKAKQLIRQNINSILDEIGILSVKDLKKIQFEERGLQLSDVEQVSFSIKNKFYSLKSSVTERRHYEQDLRKIEVYPDDVLVIHPRTDAVKPWAKELYYALMSDPNITQWLKVPKREAKPQEEAPKVEDEVLEDKPRVPAVEAEATASEPEASRPAPRQTHINFITEESNFEYRVGYYKLDQESVRIISKLRGKDYVRVLENMSWQNGQKFFNFLSRMDRIPEAKREIALSKMVNSYRLPQAKDLTDEEIIHLLHNLKHMRKG